MPPGRTTRVFGVRNESDACGFAFDLAVIMHPVSAFAPDGFAGNTRAVGGFTENIRYTFGRFSGQAQMRMHPQADKAVFEFIEGQVTMTGVHIEFQVDDVGTVYYLELKFACVSAQHLTLAVLPEVEGLQKCPVFATADIQDPAVSSRS